MTRLRLHRTAIATAAAALTAVSLTGCGGSSPTTTDTAAPAPTFASGAPGMTPGAMSPMPGMPPMPGMSSSAGQPAPAGPNAVSIDNFAFAPPALTVRAGATVTWTNRDEEPHNVVAKDGGFRSPTMGSGATFTFTFTKAGSYEYICAIHPFMHATVVVTP
ncbi:cupredoxin family copper-binding protein [Nocardia sp. NPDC052566]|uniref:cupredoxin family copper-binding protein n=1 Tax=Nocardia sp. NPDC052566 TaxID=3364330 RepID=UPI0037CB8C7A